MEPLVLPGIVTPVPTFEGPVARDVVYAIRDGRALTADLFAPEGAAATILLVHGEPVLEEGGCFWSEDRRVKDTEPLQTWAQLLASRGRAVAVINRRSSCGFTHPDAVDHDLADLIVMLESKGAPVQRLGLLGFSAGTPFVVAMARRDPRVRAVVTMYGPLDMDEPEVVSSFVGAQHPVNQRWNPFALGPLEVPHLHVWPRLDWIPNGADAFRNLAEASSAPFRMLEHPSGRHGFDFLDSDPISRSIIAEVARFFSSALQEETSAQEALFDMDASR